MIDLTGCHDISIYLGTVCNFDCVYCDRGYIKKIGDQRMYDEDVFHLKRFFEELKREGNDSFPSDLLSFHGGEPFVYVKLMDRIIEEISKVYPDFIVFIQTNGSLILKNEDFVEKWKDRLFISISYDFIYQDINRTKIDIEQTLKFLNNKGVRTQMQFVMPVDDPRVFSLNMVQSITKLWTKYRFSQLNLIPMRHYRGGDKFKVIIDGVDISQFFDAFIKFIQILYVIGINVVVDGQASGVDKHYFENHKQLVLSPDGYIYPEYDFLEYRMEDARIGQWKEQININRVSSFDENNLLDICKQCPTVGTCGLKYWYKEFEQTPRGNCKLFYNAVLLAILHSQRLKEKKNLMQWIGIQSEKEQQ